MENTDALVILFFLPFLLLGLMVSTNFYRELRQYNFELKPNCLLTRKPVVFINGPCSIFYFRKYWNAYPEILTEHGYEVFSLHLPWRGPARFTKMQKFLNQQEINSNKYHFICDEFSSAELEGLFKYSRSVASLTILKNKEELSSQDTYSRSFLNWSYKLHSWSCKSLVLPTAEDLGVQFPTSASWLLEKMQENGEQDFLG
ncbi:MAG TPA: hypothetical protein VIG33_01970 [Pseudobdellovibrionaceae bacterium]|jgi:hypothetical protein